MTLRYEWRSRSEGDDTILAVEDGSDAVVKTWTADLDVLTDFLNDMVSMTTKSGNGVDYSHRAAQEWGALVISRSDTGDVLTIDPRLYWGLIAHWFRSQGKDPHTYQATRTVSEKAGKPPRESLP